MKAQRVRVKKNKDKAVFAKTSTNKKKSTSLPLFIVEAFGCDGFGNCLFYFTFSIGHPHFYTFILKEFNDDC